jgi:anhydro-N-acetylmuramic acid kinase
MSGSSLDGLDITLNRFKLGRRGWEWELLRYATIPYTRTWKNKLSEAYKTMGVETMALNVEYGQWIGNKVNEFMADDSTEIDLIASHGHTILHRPHFGLNVQIGDGPSIARETGITTVWNFRHSDISLGGQGAPLVPMGDELLFPEYDQCLNLGGFSNVSYKKGKQRIAFDICPVNIILNRITISYFDLSYDRNGSLGRQGEVDDELLYYLNDLTYYRTKPPKSLGTEWLEENFIPQVNRYKGRPVDLLRTLYEHISLQIARILPSDPDKQVLVTGGGAFNLFLTNLIRNMSHCTIVIPEKSLVKYKEAMVFAFLGVLRLRKEVNSMASVTGALHDSCGGFVYRM